MNIKSLLQKEYMSISNETIYLFHNGKSIEIHKQRDPLLFDIVNKYIQQIHISCIDIPTTMEYVEKISKQIGSKNTEIKLPGIFNIKDDNALYYGDNKISETFGVRIIESDDQAKRNIIKFLEKLLKVDSRLVFESICDFIGCHPSIIIDDEGDLILWKHIDENFCAIHPNPDGTYNKHEIGVPITMNRHEVEANRNVTCSKGLHVCAKEYLTAYDGNIVCKCKVNVLDIVSIPTDYNNAKIRVCKYIPLQFYNSSFEVITQQLKKEEETSSGVDPTLFTTPTSNAVIFNRIIEYIRNSKTPVTIRDIQTKISLCRRKTVSDIYRLISSAPSIFTINIPKRIQNADGTLKSYCKIEIGLK